MRPFCIIFIHLSNENNLEQLSSILASSGAVTKYHRLGGLHHGNLFSHVSGTWKFKVKVPATLVSAEGSLPSLQTATFLLCSHVVKGEKEQIL